MTFREDWLLVEGVPTKFLAWGTWVEDLKDEDVVLMITGNPGITEFYMQFLCELHTLLQMPVWAVSHAGHEVPPRSKKMDSKQLYDLQQQIDHKANIIKKYVPSGCKVHVIGHSMGSKVALELLKMPELEDRIFKCYMLFPTIERIGDTRNARFIRPFINYCGSTVIFLSWIFTLLPSIVQFHLLNTTFKLAYGGSSKSVVRGGVQLIQPSVLKNVFHLVNDEFVKIKELDATSVNAYKHKMKFYFGTTDGWSPLEFYENLKDKVPDVDAIVCDKGIQHAFAINSSTVMAKMIANWVQESTE